MQLIRIIVLAAAALLSTLSIAEAQEIYVPNYEDHTVSVLDAITLAPLGVPIPILPLLGPGCGTVEEVDKPDAVQFTLDHTFAFVSIDNCDQIAVIDMATRTVVKYIQGLPGDQETRIFLRPRGDRMYVTTCAFRYITVINVRTQEMVGVINLPDGPEGGGTYPLAFSPNGRLAYAGNGYPGPSPVGCDDGPTGIYRLDLRTNTYLGRIETTKNVVQLAVHPEGGVALATGEDRILVVDLNINEEVGAVMCGVVECVYSATVGVAFTSDGTRAYVIDSGTNELSTVDTTDPLNPQELSRTPIAGLGGAWQLDISGERLYVVLSNVPTEVVVFDISVDLPVQLPGVGIAGLFGFELDVWGGPASCGTRGHGSLHPDNGNHRGHCKPPNNGSDNGKKKGHHK